MPIDWDSEFDLEMDVHEVPTTQLLQQAMFVHSNCSDLPAHRDTSKAILEKALDMLSACRHVISTVGMFSPNEEQDDIATCNLRFLLVPYLIGEIMAQTRETEPRPRLTTLSLACREYKKFMTACRDYGFMDRFVLDVLEAAESGEQVDPRISRVQKIERKKREMQLAGLVKTLWAEQADAAALEADADEATHGTFDEESERRLWTLIIRQACIKCIDQLTYLAQEQGIVSMMLRRLNEDPDEDTLDAKREEEEVLNQQKALMKERLLKIAGEIGENTVSREDIRSNVFKATNQPTYTVEQFGIMELREAQERDARTKANEAAKKAYEAERDPDEVEEEALQKQREWDDWTDDHPKGYGNSKLRPCAI